MARPSGLTVKVAAGAGPSGVELVTLSPPPQAEASTRAAITFGRRMSGVKQRPCATPGVARQGLRPARANGHSTSRTAAATFPEILPQHRHCSRPEPRVTVHRVHVKIAIDARKWRDYGIGTYVRN